MQPNDLLANGLNGGIQTLSWHLSDFSDADLVTRPTPGANHAAWQVGHLIVAEHNLASMCGTGSLAPLPAGFADRFKKDTASRDEGFATKAELLEQFTATRNSTVAWVRGMSEADLSKPAPERLQRMASNVAEVALLLATHTAMHIGQIQVIRRKLGKPILF